MLRYGVSSVRDHTALPQLPDIPTFTYEECYKTA